MSLFRVNRQTIVKFFYPWEALKGRESEFGITLEEEVTDVFFERGATDKVDAIMKRFSVDDWDWDNDDYIEVTFESGIALDTIDAEIDCINSQLAYVWEKAVKEAEENLREYDCDNCDETDDHGACKGRNSQGVCQGGFDEDYQAGRNFASKTPPQTVSPNIWDTNAPEPPPKKDEWDTNIPEVSGDWNIWNR